MFMDQVKSQYDQVSGAVKGAFAGANPTKLRLDHYAGMMDSFGDDAYASAYSAVARKPLPLTFSLLGASISPVQVVSAGIFAVALGMLVRRWMDERDRKRSRRSRSESPDGYHHHGHQSSRSGGDGDRSGGGGSSSSSKTKHRR